MTRSRLTSARQVRFTDELDDDLHEQARAEGQSFSAVVRTACRLYLDRHTPHAPEQEL